MDNRLTIKAESRRVARERGYGHSNRFRMLRPSWSKGKDGEGVTRRTYMLKLAGEIITGEPMESYLQPAHRARACSSSRKPETLYVTAFMNER